jgi:hypothetical protein
MRPPEIGHRVGSAGPFDPKALALDYGISNPAGSQIDEEITLPALFLEAFLDEATFDYPMLAATCPADGQPGLKSSHRRCSASSESSSQWKCTDRTPIEWFGRRGMTISNLASWAHSPGRLMDFAMSGSTVGKLKCRHPSTSGDRSAPPCLMPPPFVALVNFGCNALRDSKDSSEKRVGVSFARLNVYTR